MSRKEWARKIYEDLGGDEVFGAKDCSFEELYALVSDNWKYSWRLALNDSSLQLGMDFSLNRQEEKYVKESDTIEEDFMVKFLAVAVIVVGLGYGVYKALNRVKGPELPPRPRPISPPSSSPPPQLKSFLLLSVKKSELESLYPNFSSEEAFIINDAKAFYKLPRMLLSDQGEDTITAIRAITGTGTDFEHVVLAIKLSTVEMANVRKESPSSEKRKIFDNFQNKKVDVLGAVRWDDIVWPFYFLG